MNKKGFTLVELLTVIILLSLIALITTPVILGVLSTSREGLQKEQYEVVKKAAEKWGVNHLKSMPRSEGEKCYINMSSLQGYLSNNENIKDPKTGQILSGAVEITKTGNQYQYEYKDTNLGSHPCEENDFDNRIG